MSTPPKLTWLADEFEYFEKHPDWFWMVSIVIATFAILLIYFHNYLLALIIIIGGITSALHAHYLPRELEYELTSRGVRIDSVFYPYTTLDSFWVSEDDGRILIKSKKLLMPLIVIPLGETHPDLVREFLFNNMREEEHHEHFLHKLMEFFGF